MLINDAGAELASRLGIFLFLEDRPKLFLVLRCRIELLQHCADFRI